MPLFPLGSRWTPFGKIRSQPLIPWTRLYFATNRSLNCLSRGQRLVVERDGGSITSPTNTVEGPDARDTTVGLICGHTFSSY